jgi:hypothetical protein
MRRRRSEQGSAIIMVVGLMMVLSMIVTVALGYAMNTNKTARHSDDWNSALAAAEAGVHDYLSYLNGNDIYWKTVDCDNEAMRLPSTGTGTCGAKWVVKNSVGWVPVPGSATESFHYDANNVNTPAYGTIALTSTGRSGKITRTVQATLRRGGFGEFLYYTTYETLDPMYETYWSNLDTAASNCTRYAWASPARSSHCTDIQFITGDTIDGPVHSNDSILMSGSPEFTDTVTTSDTDCIPTGGKTQQQMQASCYIHGSGASPQFDAGISYRGELTPPDTNSNLNQYVDPSQTGHGCIYTGPTRIVFSGTTMKVWSKGSTTLSNRCGGDSPMGVSSVAIPPNGLILVRNIPSTSPCVSGAGTPGYIGDGFPQDNDANQALSENNCRNGNLYLEGNLNGRVTVSTDNNIIITGDLTYAGGQNGQDALGLIAINAVKIYHPVAANDACLGHNSNGNCNSWISRGDNMKRPGGTFTDNGTTFNNPNIVGAILTLNHSFTVQSYASGASLGTLHVYGSIAQKYRGPVGTSGSGMTGYLKGYSYDTRLRYSPPPYFLDPINSQWKSVASSDTSTPALYLP